MKAPNTVPEMVAKPPVITAWISERVMSARYGRMSKGASVCNNREVSLIQGRVNSLPQPVPCAPQHTVLQTKPFSQVRLMSALHYPESNHILSCTVCICAHSCFFPLFKFLLLLCLFRGSFNTSAQNWGATPSYSSCLIVYILTTQCRRSSPWGVEGHWDYTQKHWGGRRSCSAGLQTGGLVYADTCSTALCYFLTF